jgi:hypothetical protein
VPPSRPTDTELIEMAKNTDVGKAYFAKYPNNTITVQTNPLYTPINQPWVTFTPTRSEPIQYGVSFGGQDWYIDQTWINCADGHYHNKSDADFWSIFDADNGCFTSVHDNLVVANATAQVKALVEKYPRIRLQGFDSNAGQTITGSNSTIEYKYDGYWEDTFLRKVQLVVKFESGTHRILDFEAKCSEYYGPEGTTQVHSMSGTTFDMAKFLQDRYCPASTGDTYPRYH